MVRFSFNRGNSATLIVDQVILGSCVIEIKDTLTCPIRTSVLMIIAATRGTTY